MSVEQRFDGIRKAFVALLMWPGRCEPKRPELNSVGAERDNLEPPLPRYGFGTLTGQFASGERPSAAEAAAADLGREEPNMLGAANARRAKLNALVAAYQGEVTEVPFGQCSDEHSYVAVPGETFPPRLPHTPAQAPAPSVPDERCPDCTGKCALQSDSKEPCELRERIRIDDMALERILNRLITPATPHVKEKLDPSYPLHSADFGNDKDVKFRQWCERYEEANKDNKRKLVGDIRRKRWLVDHFALGGHAPAPSDLPVLEKILMDLHRFFERRSQTIGDWRQDNTRAKKLNGLERQALVIVQGLFQHCRWWTDEERAIPPTPREVVMRIAMAEGLDLKKLAREADADASHEAGGLPATVHVGDAIISFLIFTGRLQPAERDDRAAVGRAISSELKASAEKE